MAFVIKSDAKKLEMSDILQPILFIWHFKFFFPTIIKCLVFSSLIFRTHMLYHSKIDSSTLGVHFCFIFFLLLNKLKMSSANCDSLQMILLGISETKRKQNWRNTGSLWDTCPRCKRLAILPVSVDKAGSIFKIAF